MLPLLDPERDGPALHAIFGDEDCCTYLGDPATKSVAETVNLLKKWQVGTEETTWAVVESEDGPALGRVTLIPRERDTWELGIMLAPAAQGRARSRGDAANLTGFLRSTRACPGGCGAG